MQARFRRDRGGRQAPGPEAERVMRSIVGGLLFALPTVVAFYLVSG